jgi:L-lactate utilization protein LutB
MEKPVENYWRLHLQALKETLEKNNFEVFIVADAAAAKTLVLERILPAAAPRSVSWGGSMTFMGSGLYQVLREAPGITAIDTADAKVAPEEKMARRRQALAVDLFFTGSNAVTERGQLVNLDMQGNRVAALTFGPRKVVVLVGRNKIVTDIQSAMARIKRYVAPANAMRLDMQTPCVKTGRCEDCRSPERICNTWTITEKSWPKGRVAIILINADLGL